MNSVVDQLEGAIVQFVANGELLLDEDFIMNIFAPLHSIIMPIMEYLDYVFEDLTGTLIIGSRKPEYMVLLMDKLRAELFYPTHPYI